MNYFGGMIMDNPMRQTFIDDLIDEIRANTNRIYIHQCPRMRQFYRDRVFEQLDNLKLMTQETQLPPTARE